MSTETLRRLRAANALATRYYEAVKHSSKAAERCRNEAVRLRAECARVEADSTLGGALALWRAAAGMLDLQADCLRSK